MLGKSVQPTSDPHSATISRLHSTVNAAAPLPGQPVTVPAPWTFSASLRQKRLAEDAGPTRSPQENYSCLRIPLRPHGRSADDSSLSDP